MLLTKDQFRRIESLHKKLTKDVHTHYTEHCGVVADVDVAFVDQTTFGEIADSLGDQTVSYTFDLTPLGPVVLSYSLPLAYALIEYALGAKPRGKLTAEQIDTMNTIFKRDLADVESMWSAIEPVESENPMLETSTKALEKVHHRATTTCLTALEVNLPHASGLVNYSYPIDSTLGSIASKLA